MSLKTQITNAGAPAAGTAATAGNTGLSVVTGMTWRSDAGGAYLAGADDGPVTWRVDAASGLQSTITDYQIRAILRACRTATALVANGTTITFHVFTDGTTKLRVQLVVRNSLLNPGLVVLVTEFVNGGSAAILANGNTSGSPPTIPFDKDIEFTLNFRKGLTTGVYSLYLNRTLIGEHSSLETSTLNATPLDQQWTIQGNAVAGLRWELRPRAGDGVLAETWSGTDIPMDPLHDYNGPTSLTQQDHLAAWADQYLGGDFFLMTGSATDTRKLRATGGTNPQRWMREISGTAGQNKKMTTRKMIGVPLYNAAGWMSITSKRIYIPAGTWQMIIYDDAGVPLITIDYAGGVFKQGGSTLATLPTNKRYMVKVNIRNTGQATIVFFDHTTDVGVGAVTACADLTTLSGWTGFSPIGVISQEIVLGATPTTCDMDGFIVAKHLGITGVDSMSSFDTQGMTPTDAWATHSTERLARGIETNAIPGACFDGYSYGTPRFTAMGYIGRGGRTLRNTVTNALPGMAKDYGSLLILVDAHSLNDTASVVDAATQAACVAQYTADLDAVLDWANANGNMIWAWTGPQRPNQTTGTFLTTIRQDTLVMLNSVTRARIQAKQQGLFWYSDVYGTISPNFAGLYTTTVDDIHPNTAGDDTIGIAAHASRILAPFPVTSGSGFDFGFVWGFTSGLVNQTGIP